MSSKINLLSKKKLIIKNKPVVVEKTPEKVIPEKKIVPKEKLSEEDFQKKYNKPIKIKTSIESNYLFHYAHFICDFIFPLISNNYHNYLEIIREKTINQTIGNFKGLAEEIIGKNYEEITSEEYNNYPAEEIKLPLKESLKENDFLYFRQIMIEKFVKSDSKDKWPEIVLIKRSTQNILNEDEFDQVKKIMKGYRTNNGSQRREIDKINEIESLLTLRYGDRFQMVSLENKSMEYQVNLFYHAKMVVGAHGAGLINLFFCKPSTIVIESKALPWKFFDEISNNLKLNHYKIDNNVQLISNMIKNISI